MAQLYRRGIARDGRYLWMSCRQPQSCIPVEDDHTCCDASRSANIQKSGFAA